MNSTSLAHWLRSMTENFVDALDGLDVAAMDSAVKAPLMHLETLLQDASAAEELTITAAAQRCSDTICCKRQEAQVAALAQLPPLATRHRAAITFAELMREARYGDCILFRCKMAHSAAQRAITRAEWDHVATVIEIPARVDGSADANASTGLYLLEAIGDGVFLYQCARA